MRIGIDASSWVNRRGYGRFTRGLLPALLAANEASGRPHRFIAIVDSGAATADLPTDVDRAVAPTAEAVTRAASSSGRRGLRDLWLMRHAATSARLDVLLYPTVYSYFPAPRGVPAVVTIHDVIPERFPRLVFPNRRLELFWRVKVLAATRRARLILTVSRDAARGITRYLGVPAERIRVIGEALDPHFAAPNGRRSPRGNTEDAPFFLYIGGLSPHKNLASLIEAIGRLRRDPRYATARLVLAGDYTGDSFHSAYPALQALVVARGLENAVRFTGFVSDDELARLYQTTHALVLPSYCEGFGLPAVEALAHGTPVLASTGGALPEVVGDAGLYFDPDDPAGLDWALRRILEDDQLRAQLAGRGPARAACFSWERTAALTLAALAEASR